MARPPFIDSPDDVYHVTSRGNGRAEIFWYDDDRQRFLAQLADNLHRAAAQLDAFALRRQLARRATSTKTITEK